MSTPKSPRYNQKQAEIVEFFGGSSNTSWDDIAQEYAGMDEEDILAALNQMWSQDDNESLAADIYNELKWQ